MKKSTKNTINVILFLLPAFLLFVGILIAPIVLSGYYSFFDWNGFGAKTYIGFQNFVELFTSDEIEFLKSVKNSLILAGASVFLQLPLALGLALVLGRGIKGERVFLSVYFMPVLISTVVIGQLWKKMYNPSYGIINSVIRGTQFYERVTNYFHAEDIMWLGEPALALAACFLPTLWQYVGYHMLLMYAGVKSVPTDLREAAKLDGATNGQVNRYIVIPYIKPIIKVSVIFAVTGSLKSFDLIYVLTNGGPYHATEVPSTLMINMLFLRNRYGMGSTIALMLIALCFLFALIISAIFRKED